MDENANGCSNFYAMREKGEKHPIEEVGAKLRGMMPWIAANKIVDKSKN
jgi:ketol-acid reductoisomerase